MEIGCNGKTSGKNEEEELRRRKNVIIFRANEDLKLPREEQLKQDEELIQKFLVQIENIEAQASIFRKFLNLTFA